ncbi:MAG: cystathionine beta-synthase [Anaerolineae bacterium]
MDITTTNNWSVRQGIMDNILEAMGQTPLVRLNSVTRGIEADLLAKVEFFNPGGSVKDRIGLSIIEDAEASGKLRPGGTIVESTSGNSGVGLAIVAAIRGYKTVFVMPDKMSNEKIQLLRAFGARVVVTPTAVEPDDPRSYYNVAKRIVEETPNSILANQYHNPVNPQVHYETTGPEIWEQTGGQIDVFVAGLGTGGTISGVGRYLKEKNPDIQIVGVDPIGSLLYEYFYTGELGDATTYRVEGIGEDFLPSTMNFSVIDDIVRVNDQESFVMTRRLVREEGLFIGGSCGAAVEGALKYIRDKQLGADKRVVVLLPDSGSRYLSKIFNDDWMRENGYFEQTWCEASAQDVLDARGATDLIVVRPDANMLSVVQLMKANGISQVPVMEEERMVGIVHETDLLNHLLNVEHEHSPDETIADSINTDYAVALPDTSIDALMNMLTADGGAVIVLDQDRAESRVLGLLTKIDVLDYVVNHCV